VETTPLFLFPPPSNAISTPPLIFPFNSFSLPPPVQGSGISFSMRSCLNISWHRVPFICFPYPCEDHPFNPNSSLFSQSQLFGAKSDCPPVRILTFFEELNFFQFPSLAHAVNSCETVASSTSNNPTPPRRFIFLRVCSNRNFRNDGWIIVLDPLPPPPCFSSFTHRLCSTRL